MRVIGWIIVGLLAGGLARMATGSEKRGCLATLAVGLLGALLGGVLFNVAGADTSDRSTFFSILVAFVGACALLFILQALGVTNRRR